MTTRVITTDTTTQVFLLEQEDLYVAAGVTVSVSDSYAVNTTHSFAHLYIDGAVVSDNTAIYIYGGADQFANLVHVGATGTLVSPGGGTGLYMTGTNNQIVNEGSIRASTGIAIGNSAGGGNESTIFNSGTIHGTYHAIDRLTSSTTETLVITNTGMIRGVVNSFYDSGANAIEQIVNKGLMIGDVSMGLGNDLYDGRLGAIDGDVLGGAGNDRLYGGTGGEGLFGEEDNDTLMGGAGADYLSGGTGSDRASYAGATKAVTVSLANPSINAGDADGDTFNSIENLSGSNYSDSVFGNSAKNAINGGAGNDTIKGYAGNDTLTGYTGADIFVFNSALSASANVDTITDFSRVDDTIQVDNAFFIGLTAGALVASAFTDVAVSAKDASDRIIYNSDTGNLYYDRDGSGGTYSAIKFAALTGSPTLTAADFVVI